MQHSACPEARHVGKDTNQLDGRHVFFPPQKLLEAWPCCRKAIVEVHDDMDSGVHHGVEGAHSTCAKEEKHSQSKSEIKGEITFIRAPAVNHFLRYPTTARQEEGFFDRNTLTQIPHETGCKLTPLSL